MIDFERFIFSGIFIDWQGVILLKAEKYLKLSKGHESQYNYGYRKSTRSFVIKL